ncbi:YbjN domain-containing protein [Phytomonospora endophytica]|uniref:Sensory transduction regulator n=2 Tax=Phytomonospora endophytica TaxID=714109 RepID=A0A841FGP8_9ACTN|nr:YbjN domain-containing protein [Phytomonospora endophytica]MBB6032267.1 hypothetical protein [Phytomonospora endophytica]GIG68617.1 hypothetical protein Pen01_49120 [Phytomonospora endophytica]
MSPSFTGDGNTKGTDMAWWRSRRAEQDPTGAKDDVVTTEGSSAVTETTSITAKTAKVPLQRGAADDTVRENRVPDGLDPNLAADLDRLTRNAVQATTVRRLTTERITAALKRLKIRYLTDENGAVLAMWERHVLQIACEGPGGEILVLRARAYSTVSPEWVDRAYTAANEWNRTRRFLKSYVGAETESGQFPLYGEVQLPLVPGLHDALLDEVIDCAAAVSGSWADWLHDEGAVL